MANVAPGLIPAGRFPKGTQFGPNRYINWEISISWSTDPKFRIRYAMWLARLNADLA
jgi:hypothetical protein